MSQSIPREAIQQLFSAARSHHHWQNTPVSDAVLETVYNLAKWGPTSVNSVPMRILFIKSEGAKEKLYPALLGSNIEQVKTAPVTAVIAWDTAFYEHLPRLFPAFDARSLFADNPPAAESTAFRNSSLQGAYFMLAARATGLDIGPMSGFDNAKVDAAFFTGTTWKSNFLCNLGYADHTKVFPRGQRLDFAEACKVI
jgi:3-hydroxypropanoate dehydrogenase